MIDLKNLNEVQDKKELVICKIDLGEVFKMNNYITVMVCEHIKNDHF